jgi:hypothetical protein
LPGHSDRCAGGGCGNPGAAAHSSRSPDAAASRSCNATRARERARWAGINCRGGRRCGTARAISARDSATAGRLAVERHGSTTPHAENRRHQGQCEARMLSHARDHATNAPPTCSSIHATGQNLSAASDRSRIVVSSAVLPWPKRIRSKCPIRNIASTTETYTGLYPKVSLYPGLFAAFPTTLYCAKKRPSGTFQTPWL